MQPSARPAAANPGNSPNGDGRGDAAARRDKSAEPTVDFHEPVVLVTGFVEAAIFAPCLHAAVEIAAHPALLICRSALAALRLLPLLLLACIAVARAPLLTRLYRLLLRDECLAVRIPAIGFPLALLLDLHAKGNEEPTWVKGMVLADACHCLEELVLLATAVLSVGLWRPPAKSQVAVVGVPDQGIDDGECVICLGVLDPGESDFVRLQCGHAFHKHCIRQWLRKKPSCPYRCPGVVNMKQVDGRQAARGSRQAAPANAGEGQAAPAELAA